MDNCLITKWPGKEEDSGLDYQLPDGWTGDDLADASAQMNQVITSKAWHLLAHRIGLEQRAQASKAMPKIPSKNSHEEKIQAGASYHTFDRVMMLVAEIASYKSQEE